MSSPQRPQWVGASLPDPQRYDDTIVLSFSLPFGQPLDVVLSAPGAVTHSHDPSATQVTRLDNSDSTATVVFPERTQAPPGWYMMFLVSSAGVPSVAQWVRLMP